MRRRLILAVVIVGVLAASLGRARLTHAFARTLVCDGTPAPAEAVIIDNFDNNFGVFRETAVLQRGASPRRIFVPVVESEDGDSAMAAREVANVFARMAGLSHWDVIDGPDYEPISLNVAQRLRDALEGAHISSVVVVSAVFRSKRSEIIYRSVLGERGITVSCVPVLGGTRPENWTGSWHGIEDVTLQFAKLQYYRLWVMPLRRH